MYDRRYLIFCATVLGFERAIWEWGRNHRRGRFVHSSVGHELGAFLLTQAIHASKARWCLYYRSHAWNIALDCKLEAIASAITGYPDPGTSSMHLMLSPEIVDCNSIVAAQFPIAVGVAFADRNTPVVCVAGDGATNCGPFFESINIAVKHRMPICFVIEDNGLQIGTRYETTSAQTISKKCHGLGLPVQSIKYAENCLDNLISLVRKQIAALPSGPSVLHIGCTRDGGHMVSHDAPPIVPAHIAHDEQAFEMYQESLERTRIICAQSPAQGIPQ
jgi:TPP-dependent pyruvate/acetoin dehydrogenase alpha subunit